MNLRKIIREEIDNPFDWADIDPSTLHKPYVGMKFRTKNDPNSVYEIFDLSSSIVYYKYISNQTGREVKSSIPITYFKRYMEDGDWVTHYVNESDFDWAKDVPSDYYVTCQNAYVGANVMLSDRGKKEYTDDYANPHDSVGVIERVERNELSGYCIDVHWGVTDEEDIWNHYMSYDLIFV